MGFHRDESTLVASRAMRGFADGALSIVLASYAEHMGFGALEIGIIVAGTLLGSAILTLFAGVFGGKIARRTMLYLATALMLATGLGFATASTFYAILAVAVVGTLNPSAGDVSVFLPTEQSALSQIVEPARLTRAFTYYNIAGGLAGSVGALASSLPERIALATATERVLVERASFLAYAIIAAIVFLLYRRLSPAIETPPRDANAPRQALHHSRGIVIRLTILFSIDSFGGGFVVQSMLVLWIARRFALAPEALGGMFAASSLLIAASQLVARPLADRFGRINTMVFTHLPANMFLIATAFMPTATLAIICLLVRASLSSMDVPARQSLVMVAVPPEERAAAASVTNVPRSLASAISPVMAGALLDSTSFGWPLVIAGSLKALYDVLLYVQFRALERTIKT